MTPCTVATCLNKPLLIDEIIEFDMKAETKIRKEIKKFIDNEIEHRLVEEAMCSGSIAQA